MNSSKYFKPSLGVESKAATCSLPTSMVEVHCHCGQLPATKVKSV